MSIANNIAVYRKRKGYTQEQLGEMLGVSNQAVSKWESAVSLPDVMLLPKIADALGITLEELYEIKPKEKKVKADDFPKAANDLLIEYFVKQSGVRFIFTQSEEDNVKYHRDKIYESGDCVLGCISDKAGGVFVSRDISFVNTDYKTSGSENIFERQEIASTLKKLSDSHTRKVLSYMYKESFSDKNTNNKSFYIGAVAKGCGLSEEDVFEALDKLQSIDMLETYVNDDNVTEYIFLKSKAIFILVAFKVLDKLNHDFVFNVMRDTSTICDYAFEKLW